MKPSKRVINRSAEISGSVTWLRWVLGDLVTWWLGDLVVTCNVFCSFHHCYTVTHTIGDSFLSSSRVVVVYIYKDDRAGVAWQDT